jgi:hypothetical protein
VRCAPGACTWLLTVLASLGACSDTFVVGREGPSGTELCYSCRQLALECDDIASCPGPCPWADELWQTYETCVCEACDGPCWGCPAHDVFVTDTHCISCPAQVIAADGPCHEAWLACSDS